MTGNHPKKQRGVALIIAMLAVAMATILAAEMTFEGYLYVRRAAATRLMDQARLFAIGAEDWGAEILTQDLRNQTGPANTNLGQDWAFELPPLPLTDADGQDIGQLLGEIKDMQARFNINNLVTVDGETDQVSVDRLRCILEKLSLDVTVAGKIADWIDVDSNPNFPDGAEDDFYTGLEPPYLVGNAFLTSVSEIQAVDGVTPEIYAVLSPYLAALPTTGTLINVNTVERIHEDDVLPTLQCLDPSLTQGDAENIVDTRPPDGYANVNDFMAAAGISDPAIANAVARYDSIYFQTRVRVAIGTFQLSMYSFLERTSNGDVVTRLRTFGAE